MADQRRVIIRNASILDPAAGELLPDRVITVEGGHIAEVAESTAAPARTTDARLVDARGRVVMPGLIDGHVHVLAYTADLPAAAEQSPFYVAARASEILRGMLD